MCQSTGFLKTIVLFINFLLLLSGLALLVIGVATHLKTSALTDVIAGFYEAGPIATMVVGGIILLFAFLGCCGAVKESNCMLITYSIFILVLMILKLALAVGAYFNSNAVIHFVREEISRTFITNQHTFHVVESSLGCCGLNGPHDYSSYGRYALPESCCPAGGIAGACATINANVGCDSVVADVVRTSTTAIVGVCVAVAAVEILAVLFVLRLAINVRNKKSVF